MRTHCLAFLWMIAAVLPLASCLADEDSVPLWLKAQGAQPPRLYLFWQSGWTPKSNPNHVPLVSGNKPDLFQYPESSGISTGLPHQSMCPAPGTQKTRWSYEKDEPSATPPPASQAADAASLERRAASLERRAAYWSTSDYAARLSEGRDAVAWVLKETGAYGLAPYVCAVKIEGEREKRLRFWAFYDHWDLYKDWYGPRPSADPWDWVQFRPDYKAKSTWSFYKPADDGSRIHSACPNSPFSKYLADFVKLGAANGLRGVFVDNPGSLCVCSWCQAEWPVFLKQRFTPKQLKKYFGIDDYANAALNEKPFDIETKRFWSYSAARHLSRLRAAGESVVGKGNFWVCPNGTQIEFVPSNYGCDPVEWARQDAFQVGVRENIRMSEGFEALRLTHNLCFNAPNDLILGHKMMRALAPSRAWAAPLRSHVFLGQDEGLFNLAAAETLAFDGILCDTGAPWLPCAARKPFYDFYRRHESLLRSGPSVAEAGVLCLTNELYRDPADSVREVRLVTDWLSEAHVLWDAILDNGLEADNVSRYKVIFVPNVRMLDDAEVDRLLAFARAGGCLILSGEVGTAYRCGAPRPRPAFRLQDFGLRSSALTPAKPFAVASFHKGKIALCPRGFADVDVPDAYSGTDVHCDQPARSLIRETNRTTFLACLQQALAEPLASVLPPGPRAVRVAARWFTDAAGSAMTVHLANYDLRVQTADQAYYRVLRGPSTLTPASNVTLAVPLPQGHTATAVRWADFPTSQLKPLQFTALRDGVSFTVPRVGSYAFAVIALAHPPIRLADAQRLSALRGKALSPSGTLPAVEAVGKAPLQPVFAPASTSGRAEPASLDHVLRIAPGVPVLVSGVQGSDLEIRLDRPGQDKPDPYIWTPLRAFDVSAEADKGEVRWLRFWLISPSGKVAASGAVLANQSTLIKIPAKETGLFALMTEAGLGSLGVSTTGRALMAWGQPLRFEDPNPVLYFRVPAGLHQFDITTGGLDAKMRLKVLDPGGAVAWQRDDFYVHHKRQTIAVPSGGDGQIWSLAFTTETPLEKRAGRRTQIDLAPPLTGHLSPDPARLVVFD